MTEGRLPPLGGSVSEDHGVGRWGVVIERVRTGDLVLHETFRAAPEWIFSRMTDPAELVKWWGRTGSPRRRQSSTSPVGGGYRLTMQPPHGPSFHLMGALLEVDRPNCLSYTFRWEEQLPDDRETVVLLVLHPVDGGRIVEIDAIADPERVGRIAAAVLG